MSAREKLAALVRPGAVVSVWPDGGDPDGAFGWIIGCAKRGWDGPYYAVNPPAPDEEEWETPGMWEEIAKADNREAAEAIAAAIRDAVEA